MGNKFQAIKFDHLCLQELKALKIIVKIKEYKIKRAAMAEEGGPILLQVDSSYLAAKDKLIVGLISLSSLFCSDEDTNSPTFSLINNGQY